MDVVYQTDELAQLLVSPAGRCHDADDVRPALSFDFCHDDAGVILYIVSAAGEPAGFCVHSESAFHRAIDERLVSVRVKGAAFPGDLIFVSVKVPVNAYPQFCEISRRDVGIAPCRAERVDARRAHS